MQILQKDERRPGRVPLFSTDSSVWVPGCQSHELVRSIFTGSSARGEAVNSKAEIGCGGFYPVEFSPVSRRHTRMSTVYHKDVCFGCRQTLKKKMVPGVSRVGQPGFQLGRGARIQMEE